jgi:hypothetical protein
MCGGLGSLDGDVNFARLNAALDVSIWHFKRSFYTYKRPLWKALVVRRCILKVRRVWRLCHCGWRCIESSNRPINTALSATLLDIWIGIYASAGVLTMLPLEREVLQLWLRMGTVNGDANRSQLQAVSGLSIRHFPRSFYT